MGGPISWAAVLDYRKRKMLGISIRFAPVPDSGWNVTSFLVVLLLSLPYHDGRYPSTEPK